MGKLVKGAVVLALLGAAVKYGSKHPKWIEYKNSKPKQLPEVAAAKELHSDIIELSK